MPDYVSTEHGVMNADKDDRKRAIPLLDAITKEIRRAKKGGGFESRTVVGMMSCWLQAGLLLRHANYVRYSAPLFIRDTTEAPPEGKKASALLSVAITRLREYPPTANSDTHEVYFKAAEQAMIVFISEFRKVLRKTNKDKLTSFEAWVAGLVRHGKAM